MKRFLMFCALLGSLAALPADAETKPLLDEDRAASLDLMSQPKATPSQVWNVAISPAQRWALFPIVHSDKVSVRDNGKAMRRCYGALGLEIIRQTLVAHENRVSAAMVNDQTLKIHRLTAENVEWILANVVTVDRPVATELILGDLFDLLAQLRDTREAPEVPPSCLPFEALGESWAPPSAPDAPGEIECPSCRQRFTLDESKAAAPPGGRLVS